MEYSRNFQESIYPEEFDSRVNGINTWIENNRDLYDYAKDPNAFELTNVFLFAGKYASEGKEINLESVRRMWELRSKDFERCGITKENFIYQICEQSYNSAMSGKALVDDEHSHSALRRMAGVGLYLMQQRRDKGTIQYNNPHELMELIDNSKMLKIKYPHLHESLQFEKNIGRLYELQKEHLKGSILKSVQDVYDSYMGNNKETVIKKETDNREDHD